MGPEIPLPGGNLSHVVRAGDTVRRQAGPWTPHVHRLLLRLHASGVTQVPCPLGFDEAGREVLSFLPGTVGHHPLPEASRSDATLAQTAQLLRRLHDATAEVAPAWLDGWQAPRVDPVEVICDGDFAPYNCVYNDGDLVGVIDFDHAHPGPRTWDLAYAAYRFVPLMGAHNPEHRGLVDEQCRRLHGFLDAYGPFDRRSFVDLLLARLQRMIDFLVDGAAAGDERLRELIQRGDADLYARDRDHIEANRGPLSRAVGTPPPGAR